MRHAGRQSSRQAGTAPRRTHAGRCAVALVSAVWMSLAVAAPPKLAGQKVATVLDRLRTQGLTFIYNSAVIPPQLTVQEEPSAQSGLELAREVLSAYQLDI